MYRGVLSSGLGSHWRREVLRTSLWFVPALEVVAAIVLFAGTLAVDRAAYHGDFTLPGWVISGSADAARQILTTIAAAIITVIGVVFSIILLTLTLASNQFGPRMLRSEEHTSELQSQFHLVCRLLLEKKKKKINRRHRIL